MAKTLIILSLMGRDRPGMVAGLARVVAAHGGNWLDSRLAHMGGQFAGAVRVEVEAGTEAGLVEALGAAAPDMRFQWVAEEAGSSVRPRRLSQLSLSGQDQPGIVEKVFAVLGRHGVNVEELSTGTRAAPWSGLPLFEAEARLAVPEGLDLADIRAALEAIAQDLQVDIELVG